MPPLLAALISLAILPGILFSFDVAPKVVLLCLGTCALAAGMRGGIARLPASAHGRWFLTLVAIQAACLILAVLASSDPALSFGGTNWRRFGFVTQVAVLLFALVSAEVLAREPARLRAWLVIFCSAGCAAALYGCAQFFAWDPLLPAASYRTGEGEWAIIRPPGTFGHAGYAAVFYLHSAFMGSALVVVGARRREKYLGVATAILATLAILLSGTRGAVVGWLVGAALLVYWLRPAPKKWHAALLTAVILAVAAFYFSPAGQPLRSRVRWSLEDPVGGGRLMMWRDSAIMGASRWAAGWGLEVFSSVFPQHQSEALARAYPDFYHESPHNVFLDAWTSQGLPGLAVLAGFCVLAFSTAKRSPVQSALCAGLAAALASQQFLSFTAPTALWFYLSVAMMVALMPAAREARRVSRIAVALACLLLAIYGVQLLVSDRMLRVTQRQLAAGDLRAAGAVYESARKWQPAGTTADLWFSRAMLQATKANRSAADMAFGLQLAGQAAARAPLRSEDRQNAYYNLSSFCALRNDFACVERSLRAAIAVAPAWYKPHWTLARVLALSGRMEEAAVEANRAMWLDGGKHAEVRTTLAEIGAKK